MTIGDREKILQLAETFTTATLGSENSQGKCFIVSCPLSLHLENNAFPNDVYAGLFKNNPLNPHFWLTLKNSKNIIIDPTIRQFYEDAPQVYVGEKPKDFCLQEKHQFQDWINEVYTTWTIPFEFPEYHAYIDLNLLLEINVKAAIFVNNEFEELGIDINQSFKSKKYFEGIFFILNNSQSKLDRFEKLNGFDSLLSKAKIG